MEAIHRLIPAKSLDGVKRRTRPVWKMSGRLLLSENHGDSGKRMESADGDNHKGRKRFPADQRIQ